MALPAARHLTPAKARKALAGPPCGRAGRTIAHWPATNRTTDVHSKAH